MLSESQTRLLKEKFPEPADILCASEAMLCKVLNVNRRIAQDLIKTAAESVLDEEATPARHQIHRLSWFDPVLEACFENRGLAVSAGEIVELSGKSAVGKTQLALHLSLCVQMPCALGGLEASCVYICTEDAFPFSRLYQMIPKFQSLLLPTTTTSTSTHSFSDNVYVKHVIEIELLLKVLSHDIPLFFDSLANSDFPVRLLIIDSVAAMLRSEKLRPFERVSLLTELASLLRNLGRKYGVLCFLVNQVTDWMMGNEERHLPMNALGTVSGRDSLMGGKLDSLQIPSLGLSWANQIGTRLFLERPTLASSLRKLSILYSPHFPPNTCTFDVTGSGICGL